MAFVRQGLEHFVTVCIVGEVQSSHIRFAYPSDPDQEIIHDFSIHVTPGRKVAIVGSTGAYAK